MAKLVFDFKITVDGSQINKMETVNGSVCMIPFGGFVESELFTGKVLPGACDVQVTDLAGVKHMHAQYMFEGKDSTGADCHLFVDNNAYFMRGVSPKKFESVPTMMTDSPVLSEYLHRAQFRGVGGGEDDGYLHIRIYDILGD